MKNRSHDTNTLSPQRTTAWVLATDADADAAERDSGVRDLRVLDDTEGATGSGLAVLEQVPHFG